MDAFKLLSRSTNLSRKSDGKRKATGLLPPQGAGNTLAVEDQSDTINSKKRRREDVHGLLEESYRHVDIDFFGDAVEISNTLPNSYLNGGSESSHKRSHAENQSSDLEAATDPEPVQPSKDECKKILQSHKIKITKIWPTQADVLKIESSQKPKKKSSRKNSAKATEEDVDEKKDKKKLDVIPTPLTSFAQLRSRYHIDATLARNIAAQGYVNPTEVQLSAVPILLENENKASELETVPKADIGAHTWGLKADLLAVAPTGSGKTLAFLAPIINAIVGLKSSRTSNDPSSIGPTAVILAPTKELAVQIVLEARKLSAGTGISISRPRKGMRLSEPATQDHVTDADENISSNSDDEEDGKDTHDNDRRITRKMTFKAPDILVSAPLSLVKGIVSDEGHVARLESVRYLVLDEADVLLDPMFRAQTMQVWSACTSLDLRVSLWSATMGSSIESLATSTISDRRKQLLASLPRHTTGSNPYTPLIRLVVGLKDSAIPSSINHQITYCGNEAGKLLALRQLLRSRPAPSSTSTKALHPPFLIFTQTIPRAIALASELKYDIPTPISSLSTTRTPTAQPQSRIAVLHADLRPSSRSTIMSRFRAGEIWLLITTDLLARGVDFPAVNAVINYDLPNSSAAYVHRVGRTGRTVRNTHTNADTLQGETRRAGAAITFVAEEDVPYLRNVINVIEGAERAAKAKAESDTPNDNSVLPHHNHPSTSMSTSASKFESPSSSSPIKQWMLTSLPKPTKRQKQTLKKRGVESRRSTTNTSKHTDIPNTNATPKQKALALKARYQTRISTKSGFDRRLQRRRKDAAEATRARRIDGFADDS